MESRLCQSIQFSRLGLLVVFYETKRFTYSMDIMGIKIHYLSLILSISKRASSGGARFNRKGE